MQFILRHEHGWSVEEMNNELPWEREINVALLHNYLEDKKRKLKEKGLG
jgi:hypothetical protein